MIYTFVTLDSEVEKARYEKLQCINNFLSELIKHLKQELQEDKHIIYDTVVKICQPIILMLSSDFILTSFPLDVVFPAWLCL